MITAPDHNLSYNSDEAVIVQILQLRLHINITNVQLTADK